MRKMYIFAAAAAMFTLSAGVAHAEVISLTIGNAIFSALYSVGLPGALANAIAVAAPFAATPASGGARIGRR